MRCHEVLRNPSELFIEPLVRDMAHWQLGPAERALEGPAGGTAREPGTPFGGWRGTLLTTSPGGV